MRRVWNFFIVSLIICLSLSYVQMTWAQEILDWPIWVYPTATGGDETVNYMAGGDLWSTESWYIPIDFTGGPKTTTLYVTIQDRHTQYSVSDVVLIVALNPAAYNAISQVDVSPATEGSKLISQFVLVSSSNVPRGINLNQHVYKGAPPAQCYFYEFHVASNLGEKGSTTPPDHVNLAVTLHINAGVTSSEGVYVHFDCSALKNSDIVVNPFSHDTNTVAAPPQLVHDVAAISQVPDKANVQQGTLVTIGVTVWNLGGYPETFSVACYYDSSQIGIQLVTNLAPSTYANLLFSWDTTLVSPGLYYIKAMADSGNVIAEVNENNNNCASHDPVTVYALGPGALFVDKAETGVISGFDPPVVGLTTVYQLTITVANTGGSNVVNVVVQDIISSDVTLVTVGTPSQGSVTTVSPPVKIVWSIVTLAPGSATLTFKVSVTPAVPGLLYLNHKGDVSASGQGVGTVYGINDVIVTANAPPPPIAPVGGEWVPINKPQLLAPWISLISTMAIATSFVCVRRLNKQKG